MDVLPLAALLAWRAGVPHQFRDVVEELRLVVVFGPAEGSRAG